MQIITMTTEELKSMLRYVKAAFEDWEIDRDWGHILLREPIESEDKIHERVDEWCNDHEISSEDIWEDLDEQLIFMHMDLGEH